MAPLCPPPLSYARPHFIELVINENLSFNDKYSDILDFDWL